MFHLMKYRLKCMLMNKDLLFWTLGFPIILTTLFSLVLREAMETVPFSTIEIAIVEQTHVQDDPLIHTMNAIKIEEQDMFHITFMSQEEAQAALNEKSIVAYVINGERLQVFVNESNMSTTITTSFFEEYQQKMGMMKDLFAQGASVQQISEAFETTKEYQMQSQVKADLESIYFYTALAMNCLFGGYWSINAMQDTQANQCTRAARLACTPTKKQRYLLVDFLLSMGLELFFVLILFAYMYFLLNISFGVHTPQIIFVLLVGTVAGNAMGTLIGVVTTKSKSFKTGVLTSITMLCSFLSGMMVVQMKYLVQEYAPWLAMINPATMITDALYSLYYFGISQRFYINLISLFIFIIVGYGASFFMLRKRQYQSLEAR